ncbi:MAG TPA: hypothetical protein VN736_02975 [Candidatus Limnocylindrales bacterium]|nr:hypothetical protein [Candidatus Limnocylindrales bacterium]
MRRISRYLPLFLLLVCLQLASAQSSFDIGIGFGAAQDKATGAGIEGNPASLNFFNNCPVGSTSTCAASQKLNAFMMGVQLNLMLWKYLGVGGEVSFGPGKTNFVTFPSSTIQAGGANLQERTTFYDFNAILQPVKTKRAAIQVEGGIGGANLKFYASGSTTDAIIGTQNFSQFYGSSNHFQVHGGLAFQIFLTDHVFLKPQFDIHYVPNLSQYGSNVVTQEMVWLGYSWGGQ